MARPYIDQVRENYINRLIKNGFEDDALQLLKQDTYSPLFIPRILHDEEEPNINLQNNMFISLAHDMNILNTELAFTASDLERLMLNTKQRLDNVKNTLLLEKERQEDLNILCNKYSEFGEVINLSAEDFDGDLSVDNGVITGQIKTQLPVAIQVVSIEGNGYEGNEYVYKDEEYLKNKIDTSQRKFLIDHSPITIYEYSRITASNNEKEVFPLVNFDSVKAKCAITLFSQTPFNTLKISSGDKKLILCEVSISEDGVSFESIIKKTIQFNNSLKKYEMNDYIPGSGILYFPNSQYVRIVLQSAGVTNETIAFEKTELITIEDEPTTENQDVKDDPTTENEDVTNSNNQ